MNPRILSDKEKCLGCKKPLTPIENTHCVVCKPFFQGHNYLQELIQTNMLENIIFELFVVRKMKPIKIAKVLQLNYNTVKSITRRINQKKAFWNYKNIEELQDLVAQIGQFLQTIDF